MNYAEWKLRGFDHLTDGHYRNPKNRRGLYVLLVVMALVWLVLWLSGLF